MSNVLKYLGVLILLIGVVILAVHAMTGAVSNSILLAGLGIIIIGFLLHIVIGRRAS
jgi:hypothetical protein